MPFRSERQRKFLWAKHPDIAKKWTEEHGPTPVGKKKKRKHSGTDWKAEEQKMRRG